MKSKVDIASTQHVEAIDDLPKISEGVEPSIRANEDGDSPAEQVEELDLFCADDAGECDFEQIEDMLWHIEREQARERGEGPYDMLPEMEYIIANECII